MLAAPLVGEDGPLGALEVYARRPGAFGTADLALAAALADQAAIAVTNARLIEDLERSRAELAASVETERTLRAIAARIAALAEADDVLTRVVEEARRLLGSDGAHLTRMNDARSAVVPVVVAGGMSDRTATWLRTQEFPIDEGINGLAAGRDAVIWTEDYGVDPRIPHEPDDTAVARRLGLRGMAAAPLRAPGGDVIGTLAVSYRKPHAFTANDLDRLQGLADHAAIALANSLLYERLRASEALYRLLVEHSPDIVYQADADGTFTYMSESVERLLGWSPDEVVGRHFSWIIDEGSIAEAAARWEELRTDPGRTLSANLELIAKDGARHLYEVSATSLARDGMFAGMHGASRDLSERDRLERELRRQAGELAAAEERTHLARELHDSVTQALFSMGLVIRSIEVLMAEDPARAAERLRTLSELQRDALAEIRSLIFELRPGSLAENGLVPALRTHVAAVEGRLGLPVVLDADADLERLPLPVEDALYRIAQEALHNTVKHASARSVRIEVSRTADEVRLVVEDDGVGFDPDAVADDHLGLAGMRARAERVGGRLVLVPRRRGTRVEVTVPIGRG